MTNPTSNFGWQMPTSTDLVTDLPADFEVFGQAVDTDFVDLLGGTTGQVLSKASATDLDFTWINNDTGDITGVTAGTGISGGGTSGTVTVTNSMATEITAKGDLIVGTGNATFDNLPVGSNAQILVADSTASTGLKWDTPTSGGMTLISTTSLTGSSVTLSSIPQTYNEIQLWILGFTPSSSAFFRVAPNAETGSNMTICIESDGSTIAARVTTGYIRTYNSFNNASITNNIIYTFPTYTATNARKAGSYITGALNSIGGNMCENGGFKYEIGAVTSLVLSPSAGTFSAGTAYLYGVK